MYNEGFDNRYEVACVSIHEVLDSFQSTEYTKNSVDKINIHIQNILSSCYIDDIVKIGIGPVDMSKSPDLTLQAFNKESEMFLVIFNLLITREGKSKNIQKLIKKYKGDN